MFVYLFLKDTDERNNQHARARDMSSIFDA